MQSPQQDLIYIRLTTSQKTENGFETAQIFDIGGETKEKTSQKLFAVISISQPWYPSSQVAQTLLGNLSHRFQEESSGSDLEKFEQALKKVNSDLIELAHKGNTGWVGQLSAVVGLIDNRKIHLSGTGEAKAYLVREGKIHEISNGSRFKDQPSNTFSSVTSGEIQANDILTAGGVNFSNSVSTSQIKEIALQDGHLTQLASKLAKANNLGHSKYANAIIFAKSATEQPEPDVFYLDSRTSQSLTYIGKIFFSKTLKLTGELARMLSDKGARAIKFTKEKISPTIRKYFSLWGTKGKVLAKATFSKTRAKFRETGQKLKENQGRLKRPEEKKQKEKTSDKESIIGKSIYTIHEYERTLNPTLKSKIISAYHSWSIITRKFANFVRTILGDQKKRRLLLVGLILILAGYLSFSIARQNRVKDNRSSQEEITNLLEQAQKTYDDAKTAQIFNDETQAKIAYGETIRTLLPLNSDASPTALDLRKKSWEEYSKLTDTSLVKNKIVIADNSNGQVLAQFKENLYIFSPEKIEKLNLSGGQPRLVAQISPAIDKWVAITSKSDVAYLLTQNGNVFRFDFASETLEEIKLENGGKFEKGVSLGNFAKAIYLLSPAKRKIIKYSAEDSGFATGEDYFQDEKLKTAVSLAINGFVFVLDNQAIIKISKGKQIKASFEKPPLPFTTLANPWQIFADPAGENVFVLDLGNTQSPARLVEYNGKGKYLKQFILTQLGKINFAMVDEAGRKLFVKTQTKIYEITI